MRSKKLVTAKRCRLSLMKLLKKLTSEELKEIISRLSDQGVDELSSIIFNGIYCDVH